MPSTRSRRCRFASTSPHAASRACSTSSRTASGSAARYAQLLRDAAVLLLALAQVAHVAVAVVVGAVRVGELAPRASCAACAPGRPPPPAPSARATSVSLGERREPCDVERFVVRDRRDQDVVAHGQPRCRGCDRDTLGDGIRGLPHPRTSPDTRVPSAHALRESARIEGRRRAEDTWQDAAARCARQDECHHGRRERHGRRGGARARSPRRAARADRPQCRGPRGARRRSARHRPHDARRRPHRRRRGVRPRRRDRGSAPARAGAHHVRGLVDARRHLPGHDGGDALADGRQPVGHGQHHPGAAAGDCGASAPRTSPTW